MNKEIINKIKEKGYWRVIIRPTSEFYDEKRFPLDTIKRTIEESQVRYRGWYYPHFGGNNDILPISKNSVGSMVEWGAHREYWEFFRSGQFSHIFSFREDYQIDSDAEKDRIRNRFVFRTSKAKDVNKFLEIVSTVYQFTEIYSFATRLCQRSEFNDVDKFEVIIELHDVENRMLFIWDRMRDLWSPYISQINEPISFKAEFKKENLIGNFDKIALENIRETFILFGWEQPNMQAMAEDQKKLLERRI